MSFNGLKKTILAEADLLAAEATASLSQRQKIAERRITTKAQELEEEIIRAGESAGEQEAKRLYQDSHLAAKAQVLTAKQQELDELREAVVDEILGWDATQTKAMLKALLEQLPEPGGTITAGATQADILAELADTYQLTINKRRIPNDGGFIWQSKLMEINLTVRYLTAQLFKRRRSDLAKLLFS